MSPYAALNPFITTSVGENDVWNSQRFADVPAVHAQPFAALRAMVEQVRAQRRSQVRFVRGAGGAGKSHLFARLRRECGDQVFYAYAPNPPLQADTLEGFVLARFVGSLRHPARSVGGEAAPYSQLRLLAYTLLKPVVEQPLTLPQLHEAWAGISLESRKELIHEAVQLLEAEHPLVPRSVLRCLLNVLREDKEHLAAQWLSGAAHLTDNELKFLQVADPLNRAETSLVLQLFGRLAAQAGSPVVLVLDQLDLVSGQAQLDEFQRLFFSLIDQSENWVVIVGLVAERFAAWDAAMTQALRGRLGVPDSNAPLGFRLPVIDMLPVGAEQKRALLACRLESPALVEQRKKDGITSVIHPLLEEDIARLTAGGAIFPRHLLAAAAEIYEQRSSGAAPAILSASPPPLSAAAVPPAPALPAQAPAAVPPPAQAPAAVPPPAAVAAVPPPAPAVAPPPPSPPPFVAASVAPVPSSSPAPPPPPSAAAALAPVARPLVEKLPPVPAVPAPAGAARQPLAEKIDALLRQQIESTQDETDPASAVELGERTRDLIELLAVPPISSHEGGMRRSYENFDGSDRWFEWGGGKLRVVTSNAMRGSLVAVLERLKTACGDTLLLRHAVAPVSGQLTLELLNSFKACNTFHHVPASETDVLAALGRMLAALREGSYDQLSTEPPATKENVLAALRAHPLPRGLRLWEIIQKIHAPKQPAPPAPAASVLAAIARKPAAAPPAPVPAAKPPPMPPPPPPTAISARQIVARPPAPSVIKTSATPPRTPVAKLPPPSQGSAA